MPRWEDWRRKYTSAGGVARQLECQNFLHMIQRRRRNPPLRTNPKGSKIDLQETRLSTVVALSRLYPSNHGRKPFIPRQRDAGGDAHMAVPNRREAAAMRSNGHSRISEGSAPVRARALPTNAIAIPFPDATPAWRIKKLVLPASLDTTSELELGLGDRLGHRGSDIDIVRGAPTESEPKSCRTPRTRARKTKDIGHPSGSRLVRIRGESRPFGGKKLGYLMSLRDSTSRTTLVSFTDFLVVGDSAGLLLATSIWLSVGLYRYPHSLLNSDIVKKSGKIWVRLPASELHRCRRWIAVDPSVYAVQEPSAVISSPTFDRGSTWICSLANLDATVGSASSSYPQVPPRYIGCLVIQSSGSILPPGRPRVRSRSYSTSQPHRQHKEWGFVDGTWPASIGSKKLGSCNSGLLQVTARTAWVLLGNQQPIHTPHCKKSRWY
ncbi:hypothetical protein B0H13DRAFT_1878894 [Mycena leptocephala]|nr:hypothetical protein B0H13DRAFT_1878894 [Mycena leptocephala]